MSPFWWTCRRIRGEVTVDVSLLVNLQEDKGRTYSRISPFWWTCRRIRGEVTAGQRDVTLLVSLQEDMGRSYSGCQPSGEPAGGQGEKLQWMSPFWWICRRRASNSSLTEPMSWTITVSSKRFSLQGIGLVFTKVRNIFELPKSPAFFSQMSTLSNLL